MLTLGHLGTTQDPPGMPASCQTAFSANSDACNRIRQLLIQHPNLVATQSGGSVPSSDAAAAQAAIDASVALQAATHKKHVWWAVTAGVVVVAVGAGYAIDRKRRKRG